MPRIRDVMWLRIVDGPSLERARIERRPGEIVLSGVVLAAENGLPLRVDYAVTCDDGWRTRSATVTQSFGEAIRSLRLAHDGTGGWTVDGRPAPTLDGCTDVDLGISPVTNALPVNRLGLTPGRTGTIRAAWVLFPALDVVAAEQSYERLADRRYRYRDATAGFKADIEVDADGLPTDYADIWRRVAEGPAAASDRD